MTNSEILELEVRSEDIGVVTIKQYFKQLLLTLFEDSECFSGERPFGNGGWEWEIRECLIENKVIGNRIVTYEEGYCGDSEFYDKIIELITSM
ncbi:MAG: hypothetical protein RR338_01135 [Clostridia bacterium]